MTKWDNILLKNTIANSNTWSDVCCKLSLQNTRENRKKLQRAAKYYKLPTDHLRSTRWTDKELGLAISQSTSLSQVLGKLGLSQAAARAGAAAAIMRIFLP